MYDAMSINNLSIVSDIPVNREIDIGVVRFFTTNSAEDLAAKMVAILVTPPQMPSREETLTRLTMLQQELGTFLLDISNMVVSPRSSSGGA